MEKLPIPRVRTVLKVKQSTTWPNSPISYVTSSNNVLFCFLKKADRFFDISESEPLSLKLSSGSAGFRTSYTIRGEGKEPIFISGLLCVQRYAW